VQELCVPFAFWNEHDDTVSIYVVCTHDDNFVPDWIHINCPCVVEAVKDKCCAFAWHVVVEVEVRVLCTGRAKHSEGNEEKECTHENEEWRSPLERELLIEEFDVREFATAFVQAELEEVLELGSRVRRCDSIAEGVSCDLNSVSVTDRVIYEVVVGEALDAVAESTVWYIASNVEETCVQCRIVRSQHEKVY
jgi:hypothetical protein